MTLKALLITGQESETVSTLARNLIHAGGLSLFARQMKQLKAANVTEMHVVTDWFIPDFEKEIQKCCARPEHIHIHSTKEAPLRLLEHNNAGNSWLLIEEGVIIDERIIDQVIRHSSPTVITLIGPHDFLSSRTANAIPLALESSPKSGPESRNESRNELAASNFFGSVAKLSSSTLAANMRKLNSLEGLPDALKAISRAQDCEIYPVTDIPLYLAEQRRNVDLVWLPLMGREDADNGTDVLLEHYHQDNLDGIARFLHKPLEDFIVKHLCKYPVTPNQITALAGLLGLSVVYLFWSGHMMPGLLMAYGVGILYGVDGKLAQVKMRIPKFRPLIPLGEKALEYVWYTAIGAFLSTVYGPAPLVMGAALILFHLADDIQCEFFRRLTDQNISNITTFDRKFQLIAGRRNSQMWALLPFALFDAWYAGFGFICAYGIITFFIHQLRLVYHLKNFMVADSETFARNFKKTKIL